MAFTGFHYCSSPRNLTTSRLTRCIGHMMYPSSMTQGKARFKCLSTLSSSALNNLFQGRFGWHALVKFSLISEASVCMSMSCTSMSHENPVSTCTCCLLYWVQRDCNCSLQWNLTTSQLTEWIDHREAPMRARCC